MHKFIFLNLILQLNIKLSLFDFKKQTNSKKLKLPQAVVARLRFAHMRKEHCSEAVKFSKRTEPTLTDSLWHSDDNTVLVFSFERFWEPINPHILTSIRAQLFLVPLFSELSGWINCPLNHRGRNKVVRNRCERWSSTQLCRGWTQRWKFLSWQNSDKQTCKSVHREKAPMILPMVCLFTYERTHHCWKASPAIFITKSLFFKSWPRFSHK